MITLRKNQHGAVDPMMFPFAFVVIVAIMLALFGIYSYSQLNDAQSNVDQKVANALEAERQNIRTEERAAFDEREKTPYRTYQASSALSSIRVQYPKTWSAYVEEKSKGSVELNGYFHPNYVHTSNGDTLVAARIQLQDKAFADVVKSYQRKVDEGDLRVSAITVSGAKGLKFIGNFESKIVGTIVAVPVRDKTIVIWTESPDFRNDFDKIIIPNLKFNN